MFGKHFFQFSKFKVSGSTAEAESPFGGQKQVDGGISFK